MKIYFENYKFSKPSVLDEEEFRFIKTNLRMNPFYEIEPRHETIMDKFGGQIFLCIVLIACIMLVPNAPILFLPVIAGIGLALRLMNEVGAYQSAISTKKAYFKKLREVIILSDSYEDFINKFYKS